MSKSEQPEIGTATWYLKERLPCRWTRIDLQLRDLDLIRIILEQKFLSWPQICNHFFDGNKRYAYRRVWKLRRFNLIRHHRGIIEGGLYLATEKARRYFRSQFTEVPTAFEIPDVRTLDHDLLITNVRFLFERMGFGAGWISERMWRMGRSAQLWAPDGVTYIGGQCFAVEVECVQKTDRRYHDIFFRYQYQQSSEMVGCLYITADSLLEPLMKRAQGFPCIYFISEGELFGKKEKAVFRNSEKEVISIEENLEINFKEPSQASETT